MNYIDYKATIWGRLYFKEDADMQKVIKKLEEGFLPSELCDDESLKFSRFEHLVDTEEYITPEENNNQPTIEVYGKIVNTDLWEECIWNNKTK